MIYIGTNSVFTLILACVLIYFTYQENSSFTDNYIGKNIFSSDSFSPVISQSPGLLKSGWIFKRNEKYLSGKISPPKKNTVYFSLIKDTLTIGDVKISKCRRYGSVSLNSGIEIKDAQSCDISGPAEILIGDKGGATAIKVEIDGVKLVIIFDQHFLTQPSVKSNINFIVKSLY